jgi:chromate transporter
LHGNKALNGALPAMTAAVAGVILNLSIWFAVHDEFRAVQPIRSYGLSFDAPVLSRIGPAAIAVAAVAAILRFKTARRCRACSLWYRAACWGIAWRMRSQIRRKSSMGWLTSG